MMTFQFAGPVGQMIDPELLTSGMIGKVVQFQFDSAWEGLEKIAVFTAGAVARHMKLTGDTVTIPEDVLRSPWQRLQVGVLGHNENGLVMLPSQVVNGPLITQGADPEADPLYN